MNQKCEFVMASTEKHRRLSFLAVSSLAAAPCLACLSFLSACTAADSTSRGCGHGTTAVASAVVDELDVGGPAEVINTANPRTRTGFGPPPFRYWRIRGDVVTPEMTALEWASDSPAPLQWNFIGPRPVSNEYWSGSNNAGGRVVSIACHPSNSAIAYAASASGGVWKTVNSGVAWTPMSDNSANMNHGAITIDSAFPQTIYAATGEYTTGASGGGLLRSLDGGVTWTLLASSSTLSSTCSGIHVVSGSSATSPAVIHWTGAASYKRSTNGGVTWTTPISSNCSSLAVDPANSQRVFVAVNGSGIRRSLDGGASFTTLSTGLPATGFTRIVLAQSRSAPDVLYAAYANGGSSIGFYRSADGGTTWTQLTNTPAFASPQAWYDMSVGVDPVNANHVYCGGVSPQYATAGVIESTNGGQSWTEISAIGGQIHPDQHWIAFAADNTPWFGCDGGVWRRVGSSWVNCNATLGAIQNYTINEHPNDANRIMVGTQDNGSAGTSTGALVWPQLVGGDGGYGAYLNDVYTTLFTTYTYLRVYRKTATTTTDISGPWSSDSREWIAPLIADRNGGNALYGGTNRLWKNAAATSSATWTPISDTTVADGGTLTAIATVVGVPNMLWVGNSNGGVWRSDNGGSTWTRARTVDGTRIAEISTRPNSPLTACIARNAQSGSRVLRTDDGVAWTNLTGTLPSNITAKALAVDWDRGIPSIYLGSGAGMYSTFDAGTTWFKAGPDLPNVNIGQLEINRARRTIAAGTYGRGAWRSALPKPADLNFDGLVNAADLTILLNGWGACASTMNCPADISGDGSVDAADLTMLLNAWG